MSDSDFEERQQPPRRPVVRVRGDVDVAEIPRDADRRIDESDLNADKQVFYFSKKLFDFMCEGATEDRIEGAGRKNAADRKGVLIKRLEASTRTEKLRNFVQDVGAKKPSGPTYAAIKRKRNAQNKNTAVQMGKGSRDKQKVALS